MKTAFNIILGIINSISLVVLLLALSIQTPAFGMWFYKYEFEKNGSYATVNMGKDDLNKVAGHVIAYLKGSEDTLADVKTTVAGRERLFFSEREITHMEDVRVLFDIGLTVRNAAALCFAVTLLYYFICERKKMRPLFTLWSCFCGGVIALFGALAVFIALNFSKAFTLFHELLFTNDLWLLDPSKDLLINVLPNAFFQDIGIFIGVMFAVLLAAAFTAGLVFRRLAPAARPGL